MGAMGSDAAIEAADVVLMDDDPMQIAKAIKISPRKCIGIVKQNIVFFRSSSFGCLALTARSVCEHVGGHLFGCRCHDYRGSQRHPRALKHKR